MTYRTKFEHKHFAIDKFNTQVDIRLREWAHAALPAASVRAGGAALAGEFAALLHAPPTPAAPADTLHEGVKRRAVQEALARHRWEERAQDVINLYNYLFCFHSNRFCV